MASSFCWGAEAARDPTTGLVIEQGASGEPIGLGNQVPFQGVWAGTFPTRGPVCESHVLGCSGVVVVSLVLGSPTLGGSRSAAPSPSGRGFEAPCPRATRHADDLRTPPGQASLP